MTIKGFYLVGQSQDIFHQDIHIDQYHDFEALLLAVAEQYNIIEPNGKYGLRDVRPITRADFVSGIGLQDPKGEDLADLDAVLDCDADIGVTVDGEAIREPAGPEGLPLVGSYYEVFPDHLVSNGDYITFEYS